MQKIEVTSFDGNLFESSDINKGNLHNENNDIPVIIPTIDMNELTNQQIAWSQMSMKDRIISDNFAKDIFGKTNAEIFNICCNYIMDEVIPKNNSLSELAEIIDNTLQEGEIYEILNMNTEMIHEGFDSIKYAIYKNFLTELKEGKYKDVPMSIIEKHICETQLSNLSLTEKVHDQSKISPYPSFLIRDEPYIVESTESSNHCEKWAIEYEAYLMGFKADSFSCDVRNSDLRVLRKDFNESVALLESGNYDYESRSADKDQLITNQKEIIENSKLLSEDVTKEAKGYYSENYLAAHKGVNIVDVSKMTCNYITEKADNPSNIHPLFLVQLYSGKWYSKVIKGFTRGKFSHAGIALDPNLSKVYSFMPGGYTIESLDIYKETCGEDSTICIHCLFINNDDYVKLVDKLDDFLKKIHSTKYAWGRLLAIALNKPGVSNNKMVCSQFVASVLKYIDLNLSDKDPSLTTPNDFKTEDTNIYKLYEGDIYKLDSKLLKVISDKVDVLTDSVGCDYKTAKLSTSAIRNLVAQEDLSLIRAYKDFLRNDNNNTSTYRKMILPLIETYVYNLEDIPIREYTDLQYDGRDLKRLIEGE